MDLDVSYISNPNVIYPSNYLKNGTDISDLPDSYQFSHFGNEYSKMLMDMIYDTHPTGSKKFYLMKKWDTYKIWSKLGSWNRTSNPNDNLYITNSVQLYEYMAVSEDWFKSIVYTDAINIYSPLSDVGYHNAYTFKNTPNMTRNDIKADPINNGTFMGNTYYKIGDGSYLEITRGYPRNHYTHKRHIFSPYSLQSLGKTGQDIISGVYIRSQQTITTTVGDDGLGDGSLPVQSIDVSNIDLIQSNNVINQ
jgi:hypothetical protein